MFKELWALLRSDDAVARMGDDFSRMLDLSHELTVRAGAIFFEDSYSSEADERREIYKRDVKINKLERRIRKQVIAHLTLGTNPGSVPYCLLLMSLVKDVERLGDYAKNVSEVHYEGGGPLPDDENSAELREIRRLVEETFSSVNEVFARSDTDAALHLIRQGRQSNRRCDKLVARIAGSSYDAATTTSMLLGARYYKRIESHLLNVLSGIVMPVHKLDYYDEKVLESGPTG
ncbi:uncharacterized protein METZ01_LOCUS220588 [marine metagenome]|uniref:PhoU domain-containing protein n=1 Tax=marine metagenome TaxID=408172 RepID=A0A382FZ99_9ZZZZ